LSPRQTTDARRTLDRVGEGMMNQRTNQPRLSVVGGEPSSALNAAKVEASNVQLTHRQVVIDGKTFWLVPVQAAGAEQLFPPSVPETWPAAIGHEADRPRPQLSLLT